MLRLLLVLLWLLPLVVPGVPAESINDNSIISIDVSGHGALTPKNGPGGTTLQGNLLSPFSFSVNAGIASDYIDRGTTLSAHNPAGGAAFEAAFGLLYAGATITSVKLPTNPAAEVTFVGGIRPKVWDIEFDFGWTYLLYPGETLGGPTNGTNYWETFARADYKISDMIGIASGLAYSPSISNTGAWSKYAAFGMSLTLPQNLLPNDVSAKLSGGVGYSWFGNQSPALGGYPLPAYTHWNVGATFSREPFNVDLRYSNTNLSRERCYVFTGDPGAVPGGRINPLTNPDGLLSNWCGPALVAKLWFSF